MKTYIKLKCLGRFKILHCYTGFIYHELQVGPLVFQIPKRNVDLTPIGGGKSTKRRPTVWRDRMWRL